MKQKIRDSVAKSMSKIQSCITQKEQALKTYKDVSKKTATAISKVKEPNASSASVMLTSAQGLASKTKQNSIHFPKTVISQPKPVPDTTVPKASIHLSNQAFGK